MTSCLRLIAAASLVVLTTSSAFSQTSANGSIRGYVRDQQGGVLPGVTVTAASPTSPTEYRVVSDKDGYYRLLDLPPGEYVMTAELTGFSKVVRPGVIVRAGLNLGIHLEMTVGGQNETVTVKADTPLLESRSSAQSVNVSGDLQRDVPLSGRKIWTDSLLLVPGVVSQELTNNIQWLFVHGVDQNSNTFQIDGSDVASSVLSSPAYISISTEAIQDVAIKSGAVDASAPLGLGAALSVTTKEGTNHVRGAVSLVIRAKRWNSSNVPDGTSSTISFVQPDLALGGPIVRDRAWFFGSYRRIDAASGLSRTASQIATMKTLVPGFEPFDLRNTAHVSFGKSSFALGPKHRLLASYQRDPNGAENAASTSAAASLGVQGGNGAVVRLQSAWSTSFLIEAAMAYNDRGGMTKAGNADQPMRTVFQRTAISGGRLTGIGQIGSFGASNVASSASHGEKLAVSMDAKMFKRGWGGLHQFQAGISLQPTLASRITAAWVNGGLVVEDRVLLDPQDASQGSRIFRTQTYDTAQQRLTDLIASDHALYIQDSWNPAKALTLNAGVRVDIIRRTDHIFEMDTQQSTEVGPRIGITYAFTDDGRNVARLGWSRVHETTAQNWISPVSSAAGFTDRYDMNGDGTLETTFVTPGSTQLNPALSIDDDFHQPRADQWNVGVSRQFGGRVAVDIGFLNRELKDSTAYLETNAIYEDGVFKGYRNESLLNVFQVTNNRWNWHVVRELSVTVTKQTERVQLIGSYTRQWRHLAGTWQPNDPASFIQPSAFANNRGIGRQNDSSGGPNQNSLSGSALTTALQWRDHVARLGVNYRAPWDVTLAANASMQSGMWSGPVVTRIEAPDPAFGPRSLTLSNGRVVSNPLATTFRFFGATRGDGQFTLPTYTVINLRGGKTVEIAAFKLNLAVEAFNVTNRRAPLTPLPSANQLGNINYRQGGTIQLPRAVQLLVRATF